MLDNLLKISMLFFLIELKIAILRFDLIGSKEGWLTIKSINSISPLLTAFVNVVSKKENAFNWAGPFFDLWEISGLLPTFLIIL